MPGIRKTTANKVLKQVQSKSTDQGIGSPLAEALMQSTGAGIYIVQDNKFVYISPFFQELSGYSLKELAGKTSLDLVHPDDRDMVKKQAVANLKKSRSTHPYEFRFVKKNGEIISVLERISSVEYMGQRAALGSFMDINERIQLERALVRSEERFRNILESMQDSYYEVNLGGRFTFVNDATSRHLFFSRDELIGNNYKMIMSEAEALRVYDIFHQVFLTGEPNLGFAHKVTRKDGVTGFAESSVSLLKDEQGRPIGFHSVSRDVTARKLMEESLVQSEERYRTVLKEMYDSYYEVDLAGNFVFVNDSVCANLGYTRDEIIGQSYGFMLPPGEATILFAAFNEVFRTGVPNKGFAHGVLRKDGTTVYAETSVALRKNESGQVIGFRSISRDITQRMEFEQRLADMATHDFLTGLPNRLLLNDRLHIALAQAHRNKNKLAILTLDLDRFKTVNDTHGHHVGDELLKAVGQRLTGIIRSGDTIARMGGDEFLLVMSELHQSDSVSSIISKIVEAFKGPFIIEGHRLNISASIGIAIYPDDGIDMEALMRKSDSAMYDIKRHGLSQPL